MTKDGSGTLVLNADNGSSYTGNISASANGGVIKILNNNSLGNTTGTTTIGSGSTLLIAGDLLTIPEPLVLNGDGIATNQGAVRNPSGVNTITGSITLGASARMVSAGSSNTGDSLILKGNIATISGAILSMDVIKGMRLTGVVSGGGGLTKNNMDTLLFYSSASNTYSGITTINDGVVRIQNSKVFGDSSSITTAHTIINGGTLLIDMNGFTLPEPLTISGNGILTNSVYQGAVKTLYGNNTLKGQVTLAANSLINAGVISSTSDSLKLSTINTGSVTGYALTLVTNTGVRTTGVISGLGSLIKEGADTLKISTINTYTGFTKLTSGGFLLGANYVMPSTSTNEFIFNGGYLISNGFTDTLGKLSILENSYISLRYLPIHGLTFSGKGSFVAGKNVIIYGWSGLTAPALSRTGKLISSNPTQALVYLRTTGNLGSSKSGGITQFGQVVSASLGNDYNGRIYFSNNTSLTTFQLNRIRFYVDSSATYISPNRYWSAVQSGSFELLASDTIKTEPVDIIPTSSLTTTAVNPITNTTAVTGGNITTATDDAVIARGVVWSTSASPTVDLLTKTNDGTGTGTFTSNISGLTASTTYFVRAYATNSNGTSYGAQISFNTLRMPTLAVTSNAISITYSTALVGGNIITENGFAVTERGFVWATTANPTTASTGKLVVSGTSIGSYTGTITGLTNSTLYYVRSYAINAQGTNYGDQITFTSAIPPAGSGLSSGTAATSAKAIQTAFPSSPDGVYWINLPTVGPTEIYCLMDSKYDGGGWMLALKAPETGNTFGYDATYWTSSTNNLNTASPSRLSTSNTDAKYDVMNYYVAGNDLLALWPDIPNSTADKGSTTNSGSISGLTQWSWMAKSVLGGNTTMQAKLNSAQASLISNPGGVASGSGTTSVFNFTGFGAGTYNPFSSQIGFTFYGFNYTGSAANKARWGFGWNNEADQGSNDASGGIGLNRVLFSAGDFFSCCGGFTGLNKQQKVEIYVR